VQSTSSAERALVVSVHDVAPATLAETRRWLADLDGFGIPGVLLAVPGPWRGTPLSDAPELTGLLRDAAAAGHEIALHGWSHEAQPGSGRALRRWSGGVAARGAGEFWTLDEDAARRRIEQGRAALRAAGLDVAGFVPPGYLASPGARDALKASGLRYWTSHFFVHDLADGSRVFAPSVSHRPALEDGAVSGASRRPVLERTGELMIGGCSRLLPRPGSPLRLALHPDDLHRRGLRDATLRAIERVLGSGARAVTYSRLLDSRTHTQTPARSRTRDGAADRPTAAAR
jgi:predicted deacetylase